MNIGDDIIDTRDVIERIEEIETELEDEEIDPDEATALRTERDALAELIDTVGDEARHGETLIRDEYFEDYAEELAADLGLLDDSHDVWPFRCIDWSQAADELRADYSATVIDGHTYWFRA